MIVAFPIEGDKGLKSRLADKFWKARYFAVARLSQGKLEGVDIVRSEFGGYPQLLHDLDVNVLICSSIGEKMREMVENEGIIVFNSSGTVSSSLKKFLPKLTEIEKKLIEEKERQEKLRNALEKARSQMVSFWVDVPQDPNFFFVSVDIGNGMFLSFDKTVKGERVILQRLAGKEEGIAVPDRDPDLEYESLHFYGPRLAKRERTRWWDLGRFDVINDEVLETIWEDEMPKDVEEKLGEMTGQIYKDLDNLDKARIKALNDYLRGLVDRYSQIIAEYSDKD